MADDDLLFDGFPGGFPSDDLVNTYINRARLDDGDPIIIRIDGAVKCFRCGHPYRDHPWDENELDWQGNPYLRVGCDGRLLKL